MAWYNFWKDNWRLVKTIEVDVSYNSQKGKVYLHLFESSKGKRKVEPAITVVLDSYTKVENIVKLLPIYHSQVYRWLAGRYDPDIPRYSDIPEEDTVNALKGKI